RDVGLDGDGLAALARDVLHDGVRGLGVGHVVHDDRGAGSAERLGDAFSDAGVGAGHESFLAFERLVGHTGSFPTCWGHSHSRTARGLSISLARSLAREITEDGWSGVCSHAPDMIEAGDPSNPKPAAVCNICDKAIDR